MHTTAPPTASAKAAGRRLLWLGIGLVLLGRLVRVAFMFGAGIMPSPWWAPVLTTLGVALITLSLVRRFTASRIAALVLVGLLAVGDWWFVLGYSRIPAYTGPVSAQQPFPAFSPAALADGTPFTRDDLVGEQDTVLVFFRGFW
jgi:hypothetical protein